MKRLYYFIVETLNGKTTLSDTEENIKKLYDKIKNSYNFISISKIYKKNKEF